MKKLTFLLALVAAIVLYACNKDWQVGDKNLEQFSIQTVKKHYASLNGALGKVNPILADSKSTELLWSRAYLEHNQDGEDFVEVPLISKKKTVRAYNFDEDNVAIPPDGSVAEASIQKLLFYRTGDGEIQQSILTYIPDKAYLIRRKAEVHLNTLKKMQSNFFGYIEYKTLDGNIVKVLRIENGKVKRKINMMSRSKNLQAGVSASTSNDCPEICWTEYDMVCEEKPDNEGYTYFDCKRVEKRVCGPNPNPGCNVGPTPPGTGPEPPIWYDCNGDAYGNAYESSCGCVGGYTGVSHCQPDFTFCNGITQAEQTQIESAFRAVANQNCATNRMVNELAGVSNLSLELCISGGSDPGVYIPNTKTIRFSSFWNATDIDIFRHQLFHAYQDNIGYPGGIGVYLTPGSHGSVNIDFEQAVFEDIIMGYAHALDASNDATAKFLYNNWIANLTSSGYPNIPTVHNFDNSFSMFLEAYANITQNNGGGTADLYLKPYALRKLFTNLAQGSCF